LLRYFIYFWETFDDLTLPILNVCATMWAWPEVGKAKTWKLRWLTLNP
jgi:hypothetical protein